MRSLAAVLIVLTACWAGNEPRPDPLTSSPPGPTANTDVGATSASPAPTNGPVTGAFDTCWTSPTSGPSGTVTFEDVTESWDLLEPLKGMFVHAVAWGDPDGDGRPDVVVGTFGDRPPDRYRHRGALQAGPDRLLVSGPRFQAADLAGHAGRTAGAVFADLDADGDDDLFLARNGLRPDRPGHPAEMFRNEGGDLTPVVDSTIPEDLWGRSVGVLDVDEDGLLDLFITEDRAGRGSSVVLQNQGGLSWTMANGDWSVPDGLHGLGVATGDVDDDGHRDVFVAGSNRLFMGSGTGLAETDVPELKWEALGDEDWVSGAAFGDLNRDRLPDLVIGHHYNSTTSHGTRVPIRVYLNRSTDQGEPRFEEVTDQAGLPDLATKAPHVEIADLDNDGWPDILTTASAGDGSLPAVFRHLGVVDGTPRFEPPAGLGHAHYWVTGPSADVDRDGRLDVLLGEFDPALPSLALRNTSPTGHWLEVSVNGPGRGVGAKVSIYGEGSLNQPADLLGSREIVASEGYAAGSLPYAHFGSGDVERLDVEVVLTDGSRHTATDVPADRHVRLGGGC